MYYLPSYLSACVPLPVLTDRTACVSPDTRRFPTCPAVSNLWVMPANYVGMCSLYVNPNGHWVARCWADYRTCVWPGGLST